MSEEPLILIRAPNWLGDCVMSLPAFDALHSALPQARIHAACRPGLAAVYADHPAVEQVVPCPASGGLFSLFDLLSSGRGLRCRSYDTGLLLTNSFSTALWLWRTGAKRRIGADTDARGFLLTDPVPATAELKALHMTAYYLALTEHAAPSITEARAATDRDALPLPQLTVPEEGREQATKLLERLNVEPPYAVFAPLSAYGAVKDWSAERYAQVAGRLYEERKLSCLIAGTSSQRAACEAIASQAGAQSVAGETDLAGFLGLIAGAALYVGGDSGGAHAAGALDVPAVVIFGITEPSRTRPMGKRITLIGKGGESTPNLKDPATCERAKQALAAIAVDEVAQAAIKALS